MKRRLVHDIDHNAEEDLGLDSLQIDVTTLQAARSIKRFHDEVPFYHHSQSSQPQESASNPPPPPRRDSVEQHFKRRSSSSVSSVSSQSPAQQRSLKTRFRTSFNKSRFQRS